MIYVGECFAYVLIQNAVLDEAQARIKIAGRHINKFRYAGETIFMAENKKELKKLSLDESKEPLC